MLLYRFSEIAAGAPFPRTILFLYSPFSVLKRHRNIFFFAYTILFAFRIITQIIAERILLNITINRMFEKIMSRGYGTLCNTTTLTLLRSKAPDI